MTSSAAIAAQVGVADVMAFRQERRASRVSGVERLSQALFGSPSIRRAHGGADASLVPPALRSQAWRRRRRETPVFEIDRRGSESDERLPRIWVSEPVFDECTGDYAGRVYVGAYPNGSDRGGWRAFELAGRYLGEALGCDAAASALRVECMRAAEILYLHAAHRGNVEALVKLAGIYGQDACCGRYWKGVLEQRARHGFEASADERMIACLAQAAALGSGEACWKLADAVKAGRACAQDKARAFLLYRRAFACAGGDTWGRISVSAMESVDVAQAGVAALRLGASYERGWGCSQSFEVARSWYRIASDLLDEALEEGSWRFKKERSEAHGGVARMDQEICGCY